MHEGRNYTQSKVLNTSASSSSSGRTHPNPSHNLFASSSPNDKSNEKKIHHLSFLVRSHYHLYPSDQIISRNQQSQKLGEPSSIYSSSISANRTISKRSSAPPPPLLVPIRCRFLQNQYQPVSSTCIYWLLH